MVNSTAQAIGTKKQIIEITLQNATFNLKTLNAVHFLATILKDIFYDYTD
jgi:hypothetical protein